MEISALQVGGMMLGMGLVFRGWRHLKEIRGRDYSHLPDFLIWVGLGVVVLGAFA